MCGVPAAGPLWSCVTWRSSGPGSCGDAEGQGGGEAAGRAPGAQECRRCGCREEAGSGRPRARSCCPAWVPASRAPGWLGRGGLDAERPPRAWPPDAGLLPILLAAPGRSHLSAGREVKARVCVCFFPGLMFNKGIGQHILKNPLVVNSIIDKVGVKEGVVDRLQSVPGPRSLSGVP